MTFGALGLVFLLTGCGTSDQLQSIAITPASGSEVLSAVGQTAQFHAVGTYVDGKNGYSYTQDITSQVAWTSLNTAVATVSKTGVVTAASAGTANIEATSEGATNPISAQSSVTVNAAATGGSGSSSSVLTSITIVPGAQSVNAIGETGQFIAIGNYSGTPATLDMTNQVTWASSDVTVGKITQGGLASGLNAGSTTITAAATSGSGALVVATAGFSVGSSGSVGLPLVAIDKVGANAALGNVTGTYIGPANTPITPINCGPQASSGQCSATFPVGTTIYFQTTDSSTPGSSPLFGGWSANCVTPVPANNPVGIVPGPYSCYVQLPANATSNDSIGAIFD